MAKQIVIVSGKGGTGKTVISAAFANIAKNKVIVDADVDAADLFLLLNPINKETHKFSGGYKAVIDSSLCNQCANCYSYCRFEAIKKNTNRFTIDEILCEGCGICAKICQNNAINMYLTESGEWYVSETKQGIFIHAKLGIAEENSGKLVSLIKNKAVEIAKEKNCDWIIIDGPPGIGCPAIATIGNSDCAIVITEPTLSGLHDSNRIIELIKYFAIPIKLIINKYDLNLEMTAKIEEFCRAAQIEIIGKLMFDKNVVQSIIDGQSVMEQPKFQYQHVLLNAWHRIEHTINK